nr:MAG TPA: hypothetical protein [Bacteriophage sp.]
MIRYHPIWGLVVIGTNLKLFNLIPSCKNTNICSRFYIVLFPFFCQEFLKIYFLKYNKTDRLTFFKLICQSFQTL